MSGESTQADCDLSEGEQPCINGNLEILEAEGVGKPWLPARCSDELAGEGNVVAMLALPGQSRGLWDQLKPEAEISWGVAIQNKKCAMCRAQIPPDYLDHPVLLEKVLPTTTNSEATEGYHWYYEGRNGWWKYDERSNNELETSFNAGDGECKLLLAGALYVINFQNMVQVQSRDPSRRRRIKRDTPTLPAKGIAGIKITDNNPRQPTKSESEQSHDSHNQSADSAEVIIDNEVETIEIVDDAENSQDNFISYRNNTIGELIERISSIDIQEQSGTNTSADNSTSQGT